MPAEASDAFSRLLALLKNSRELAVHRQQRPLAVDVMRACKIQAEASGLFEDPLVLDELILAIPGRMNIPLSELFDRAEEEIRSAAFRAGAFRIYVAAFDKALAVAGAPPSMLGV